MSEQIHPQSKKKTSTKLQSVTYQQIYYSTLNMELAVLKKTLPFTVYSRI